MNVHVAHCFVHTDVMHKPVHTYLYVSTLPLSLHTSGVHTNVLEKDI